jgi:hypothetical protein
VTTAAGLAGLGSIELRSRRTSTRTLWQRSDCLPPRSLWSVVPPCAAREAAVAITAASAFLEGSRIAAFARLWED